jgi:hypothetical protein
VHASHVRCPAAFPELPLSEWCRPRRTRHENVSRLDHFWYAYATAGWYQAGTLASQLERLM